MRSKLLLTLMLLVGLVVLVIPMGSALALGSPPGADWNNVQQSVGVSPSLTYNNTYVDYSIDLTNYLAVSPKISADAINISLTFTPPGLDGLPDASQAVVIATNINLPAGAGSIIHYGPPGSPSPIIPIAALHVLISVNPGVTIARGQSHIVGTLLTDPESSIIDDTKDIPLAIMSPNTVTTITSSAPQVISGGSVTLTVTESNTGTVSLTSPRVELTGGLTQTLTKNLAGWWVGGDTNGDGILDPGETWTWSHDSGTIAVTTTFTAQGHGFIGTTGTDITSPTYPSELASVTVTLTQRPPTTPTMGQWGMIAMATLLAGSLVWVVRKRQTSSGSPEAK